jgi:hypothetical protein
LKFQKTASSNYRVECWEVKQFQKEAEQEFWIPKETREREMKSERLNSGNKRFIWGNYDLGSPVNN